MVQDPYFYLGLGTIQKRTHTFDYVFIITLIVCLNNKMVPHFGMQMLET